MTTIMHPTLSHRATTETLLATVLAAVVLFVVLAWAQTWSVGPANSAPLGDLPVPTAQAQVAPPPPTQQHTAAGVPDAAPAPTPQPQIAPPQRVCSSQPPPSNPKGLLPSQGVPQLQLLQAQASVASSVA